jgi:cell division protein ZapB
MSAPSPFDQIAERVERLLMRYEETQRTNALLQQQVEALAHERDALKARLMAARTRIDAMLGQLPDVPEPPPEAAAQAEPGELPPTDSPLHAP